MKLLINTSLVLSLLLPTLSSAIPLDSTSKWEETTGSDELIISNLNITKDGYSVYYYRLNEDNLHPDTSYMKYALNFLPVYYTTYASPYANDNNIKNSNNNAIMRRMTFNSMLDEFINKGTSPFSYIQSLSETDRFLDARRTIGNNWTLSQSKIGNTPILPFSEVFNTNSKEVINHQQRLDVPTGTTLMIFGLGLVGLGLIHRPFSI